MKVNWGLILILVGNAFYWFSVFKHGFFIPTMWTIVIAALVGIVLKLYENRY